MIAKSTAPATEDASAGPFLRDKRGWLWALAAVVLLAIACRVGALGSRLHVDDAFSWYVATAPGAHAFLTRLAQNENTPPLFYLLLSLMPSDTPTWLRIPALIPGILLSPVLYLMLRGRVGGLVALLSALAVAVAPFLVTYSDLARGFMLADLALLTCVWALLALMDKDTPARWAMFVLAGAVALYTEYDSAIVLLAIVLVGLWLGVPRRSRLVVAATVTFATMLAWIPEIIRAQNQVGHTKLSPLNATPSVTALRDLIVTLVFGENGGTSNGAARWGLALVIVILLSFAALRLRNGWSERDIRTRRTLLMLAGAAGLTVVGYALAAVVGIHVFNQRYLTILIVLTCPVSIAAIVDLDQRALIAAVAAVLAIVGIVNAVRRSGGEYEPSFEPVRALALADRPRTVLTNTPIAIYYLPSLHVIMDRSYNLGPGLGSTCRTPCLTIDDDRVHGGTPRHLLGPPQVIGPYVLSLKH